jgi:hypothetical protein
MLRSDLVLGKAWLSEDWQPSWLLLTLSCLTDMRRRIWLYLVDVTHRVWHSPVVFLHVELVRCISNIISYLES